MGRKLRRHSESCKNCGHIWKSGPNEFCPSCGQGNTHLDIHLKHWILELIEGIFHVDGKLWITLRYLFIKPGQMSKEYAEGKRMKFIPPIRLYLFVSFVFFIALSTLNQSENVVHATLSEDYLKQPWEDVRINMLGENTVGLNGIYATRREIREAYAKGENAVDSLLTSSGLVYGDSVTRGFWRQAARIEVLGPKAFQAKIMKMFSLGVFLLMPFYAWMLSWFFRKPKRWFTAHLVLSVHEHILLFLGLLLSILFIQLGFQGGVASTLIALGLLHFLAVKNFYSAGFWATLWRYLILSLFYFLLLGLFFVLAAILSFALT